MHIAHQLKAQKVVSSIPQFGVLLDLDAYIEDPPYPDALTISKFVSDSEEDFRDKKNLGIVVTRSGAAKFKEAGVEDPAVHFKEKVIRVKGTVIIKMDRPRIDSSSAWRS